MKTALVMGITGGFGGHVAEALRARGYRIRALMRDAAKLPQRFAHVEVVIGDAGDIEAVRRAADGVELMVYAISPDKYQWKDRAIPWLDNAATVAEEKGITMVFPGNVYVFDPADGPVFTEAMPLRPITEKGEMRKAMEERLKRAAQQGARVIILRAGDFIGANTRSSWIQALLGAGKKGYKLSTTGPLNSKHTWAYLPDVAQTVAALVAMQEELPRYNVFHFKGYQVSFTDMAEAIYKASGRAVRLTHFPWMIIRLLSPFSTLFRGLIEMRYLWEQEINLDETKLVQALGGKIVHTDLGAALLDSGLTTQAALDRASHKKMLLN